MAVKPAGVTPKVSGYRNAKGKDAVGFDIEYAEYSVEFEGVTVWRRFAEFVALNNVLSQKLELPHVLPVTFYVQTKCIPMSTTVSAVATYTTETGEPRTSRVSFALPLACVGRLVPAIKSSTFKLTVDTNKGPVPLRPLFEDMFSQPGVNEVVVGGGASVNTVLSFQYWYADPSYDQCCDDTQLHVPYTAYTFLVAGYTRDVRFGGATGPGWALACVEINQ